MDNQTMENLLDLLQQHWPKMPEEKKAYLSGYAQGVADTQNEEKSA